MNERSEQAGRCSPEDRLLGDFATLFAQLDNVRTVAPISGGLQRLLSTIDSIKRAPTRN